MEPWAEEAFDFEALETVDHDLSPLAISDILRNENASGPLKLAARRYSQTRS
jgi:hypothetical protein